MKKIITGPAAAFGCVCIVLILMCTFFVADTYAAAVTSGTTTKKEQTIKVDLTEGTAVITVSDPDSWVYAQLQTTGGNKIGTAVNGENMLVDLGQEKTFTVPVKKEKTYYLYLRGNNEGASYGIKTISPGGTLTSGEPKLSTSYADNKTVTWHKIKVKKPGALRVTVKDSSYRYPGYSKVQLKKDDAVLVGDEHLIKGLGFSTVYGVSKGTYYVGVRSSSELYKITAELTEMSPMECGGTKADAVAVKKKTTGQGIIQPGDATESWYKAPIPARTVKGEKHTVKISAQNNNFNTKGGIKVKMHYKKTTDGKTVTVKKEYLLNNSEKSITLSPFKDKNRNVYIGVSSAEGATGVFEIYWE